MAKKTKSAFDPKKFLATVNGGRSLTKYRKGAVIFSQGEPANAVFYIQKGKIKIVVTSDQGKEAVVAILGAGDFLGEGSLVGQPLRLATLQRKASLSHCPRATDLPRRLREKFPGSLLYLRVRYSG